MAQAGKGRLNYRCPSCFMRDLDIDMFYDSDKKEYYCIRCQYTGTEEDVLQKNQMARFRYRFINKRFSMDEFEKFDSLTAAAFSAIILSCKPERLLSAAVTPPHLDAAPVWGGCSVRTASLSCLGLCAAQN